MKTYILSINFIVEDFILARCNNINHLKEYIPCRKKFYLMICLTYQKQK